MNKISKQKISNGTAGPNLTAVQLVTRMSGPIWFTPVSSKAVSRRPRQVSMESWTHVCCKRQQRCDTHTPFTWMLATFFCIHTYCRDVQSCNMIERNIKNKDIIYKRWVFCCSCFSKFTAAACGPAGEVGDNDRSLPPQRCLTSQTPDVVPYNHFSHTTFLHVFPLHTFSFLFVAALQVDQLMCHKLFESLQILSIELHIIVPSPFHPEWFHGALAAFVQRQAVGEVNDLIVRTVDHQNR